MDITVNQKKNTKNKHHILRRSSIPQYSEAAERIFGIHSGRQKITCMTKGRRSDNLYTEDSHRYITPLEYQSLRRGGSLVRPAGRWDSVCSRVVKNYQSRLGITRSDRLIRVFTRHYQSWRSDIFQGTDSLFSSLSPHKLWNVSMIAAVLIGMVSMSFIYRFLGPGASAETDTASTSPTHTEQMMELNSSKIEEGVILGAETQMTNEGSTDEYWEQLLGKMDIKSEEDRQQEKFETTVTEMVKDYPIEKMLPYIFEKDRTVASFLVSIAKKESNWGKRVPVLEGQDCYNYWGYRGIRRLMGTGGHTCFNSRKDAVDTVAKRIQTLITKNNLDTPAKMIIWKCGSSCAAHDSYSVKKWISDVELYYDKINKQD